MDFDAAIYDAITKSTIEELEQIKAAGPGAVICRPPAPSLSVGAFDIEAVKKRFAVYSDEIDRMVADAGAFVVTDENTNAMAVEIASSCKRLAKRIEDQRKAIVKEPNEYIKGVNTVAKSFTARLDHIEYDLKRKISMYMAELEKKRREAERRAQEEARKLQAKIDKEAKAAGIEAPQVQLPVASEKLEPVRTESGSASLRSAWKWKEIDFAKVPDEYKMLNTTAINKSVRAGIRNIPGLEIYEEKETVLRT